jgi:hypothetical protein
MSFRVQYPIAIDQVRQTHGRDQINIETYTSVDDTFEVILLKVTPLSYIEERQYDGMPWRSALGNINIIPWSKLDYPKERGAYVECILYCISPKLHSHFSDGDIGYVILYSSQFHLRQVDINFPRLKAWTSGHTEKALIAK